MTTDELTRTLVRDLTPVRRLPGAAVRTVLWALIAVTCVGVATFALNVRADLPVKLHDPEFLVECSSLLLLFGSAARSAFQLSVPGGDRARALVLPLLAFLLATALVVVRYASELSLPSPGLGCVWRMVELTLVPAVTSLLMLRRGAALERGWTGLLALLAAASLAMLATRMLCAVDEPGHILVWHLGPVVVAALVGVGVGRRALS